MAQTRICVLGASLEIGYPYRPSGTVSYVKQIQVGLDAIWKTSIDCYSIAEPAVASFHLADAIEDVLAFDPTLVVLCIGENEFSDRLFSGVTLVPAGLAVLKDRVSRGQFLWKQVGNLLAPKGKRGEGIESARKKILERVLEAEPDKPAFDSLPVLNEDRELLIHRMTSSLAIIAQACARRKIPLVIALAPHNLVGAWPWQSSKARDHFLHGRDLLRKGQKDEAKKVLLESLELDGCPMHATPALMAGMEQAARDAKVPFLTLNDAVLGPNGLPDPDLFLDHAHLTVEGHRRLAEWLVKQLSALDLLPPLPKSWLQDFRTRTRVHADKSVNAVQRTAARVEMLFANAVFFLLFGNFQDALPKFRDAFSLGATGDIVRDTDLCLKLLYCVYRLAGRQGEWDVYTAEERQAKGLEVYKELLIAREQGLLQEYLDGILAGK